MEKINQTAIILLLIISTLLAACNKDRQSVEPVQFPVLSNVENILLKDIVRNRLPSPFYHFSYSDDSVVSEISFANNMDVYRLHYENKRLDQMLNIKNGNRLEYTYTGDRVSMITEFTGRTGFKRYECYFDYIPDNLLAQVQWFRFIDNGTVRKPYRKLMFTYYADGNLAGTDDFFAAANGEMQWHTHIQYKDYDDGINVDDFTLVKNFFEPLLFLPAIKLQKNNAATEILTTIKNDFIITYHYQYLNGLPVSQEGTMTQTRGLDSGKSSNFTSSFSYY
ncbi:hypothetical protein [Flavihumibacter fluvii]|uniref:hypothetical protein n=1 Tax=Flavihumibacter fluvii TaxID=2838157 RepID=UPI001BDEA98F|nr:hypothetical protein [Flavihumibacter fluvii]ULQ51992.1 hypothetical protein KJS93_18025 [Flavihumibacter fluvii]